MVFCYLLFFIPVVCVLQQSSESERSSPEVSMADVPAEVGDPDNQEVIKRQRLIAKHELRLQMAVLELELAECEEKLQKQVWK